MPEQERFKYRLALALGHPFPDQLMRIMSAKTFIAWQQYAAIEPFGEERADLRMGILASTVVNVAMGVTGSKGKLSSPADFMPFTDRPQPKERTAEDMLYQVKILNKLMGGSFVDKRSLKEVA